MTDPVPLLVGAALVGVLHMSAPDHWVTLCILGRESCWSRKKLFGVSLVTASGHAVLSAVLGFGIAVVGIAFSRLISSYISYVVGFVMLAVGLFVGVRALVSKKKEEVTPGEKLLEKEKKNASRLNGIGYFAVLGAALSHTSLLCFHHSRSAVCSLPSHHLCRNLDSVAIGSCSSRGQRTCQNI